ncbi:MAG: hypothetical protein LBB22_06575 [Treponema sp.]|nr:hypothetical protein [Treponema sp.]
MNDPPHRLAFLHGILQVGLYRTFVPSTDSPVDEPTGSEVLTDLICEVQHFLYFYSQWRLNTPPLCGGEVDFHVIILVLFFNLW